MTNVNALLQNELEKANLLEQARKAIGAELNRQREKVHEAFANDDGLKQAEAFGYKAGISKAFDIILTIERDHYIAAQRRLEESTGETHI